MSCDSGFKYIALLNRRAYVSGGITFEIIILVGASQSRCFHSVDGSMVKYVIYIGVMPRLLIAFVTLLSRRACFITYMLCW